MEVSKNHWDEIYSRKKSDELSWTQDVPSASLNFLHEFNIPKDASIIDVGGGESRLVDFLLNEGFSDITVLDISEQALQRSRERLGKRANQVQWICDDIMNFVPARKYDVWHDRATFHFLNADAQIAKYVSLASGSLKSFGHLVIGTFSEKGPLKCSGLPVRQYSEQNLAFTLNVHFKKLRCITEDHQTPFHTIQNFLFCSFRKAT